MKYVASCSFGKDSLAAIVAAERAGVQTDGAVYCWIMFDCETSAELPEHEEFIHCTAIPLLKSRYGIKSTIVLEKRTYCDCFYAVKSRKCSKNKGQTWGFPSLWTPWCNGSLKIPPVKHWRKAAGEYVSIAGIAPGEKSGRKRKPWTESICRLWGKGSQRPQLLIFASVRDFCPRHAKRDGPASGAGFAIIRG